MNVLKHQIKFPAVECIGLYRAELALKTAFGLNNMAGR